DGHQGPVFGAAYSPDGRFIATVGADGAARLWDAATFAPQRNLTATADRLVHAAFNAAGTRLVTSGRDSMVRIWDALRDTPPLDLFGHEGGVLYATFSPDDSLVVSV